jgi:hypothetical protein
VPCETQQPITDLSTPSSGPIQQTNAGMSAPGAQARWKGATQNAVPALQEIAAASGLKLNTSQMSGGSSKSGASGSSGGGGASGAGGASGGGGGAGGGSGGGNPISQAGNAVGQAIAGVLKSS